MSEFVREMAMQMLEARPDETLHESLAESLNISVKRVGRTGGVLRSRQIVAAIICAWEMVHCYDHALVPREEPKP